MLLCMYKAKGIDIIMKKLSIEVKKILIAGIVDISQPLPIVIEDIINTLLDLAASTSSQLYYQNAAEFIVAYLSIGGSYLSHKSLFDKVLQEAGFQSEQIHRLQTKNHPVPLKKAAIRSLVGKWPSISL